MDIDPTKPLAAFGFLTVLESAEHGLFGGYLVLSTQGRPLEFRCTTPVKASRAQEILYGPTLRPYLLAEMIGKALVDGAETPVRVILTDQREMLPLAALHREEVLCVEPRETGRDDAGTCEYGGSAITAFTGGPRSIEALAATLGELAAHIDLDEPFGRVRAALVEAQLALPDAAEVDDERAAAA